MLARPLAHLGHRIRHRIRYGRSVPFSSTVDAQPFPPSLTGTASSSRPQPEERQNAVYAARIRRRRALARAIGKVVPLLRLGLLLAGYAWLLLIGWEGHGREVYVDENALQPGTVTTNWGWSDVHHADRLSDKVEIASRGDAEERAAFLESEFRELGLPTGLQRYTFTTPSNSSLASGVNVYSILRSPRTSGREAIVLSAAWQSRLAPDPEADSLQHNNGTEDKGTANEPTSKVGWEGGGRLNMRGVAIVLALARYLSEYSHWSKDLIFVVNDGHLDGMQAWLAAYYGTGQTNLHADQLEGTNGGTIWTALNIDYPEDSFSHLGLFYEGLNGQLPNMDVLNSLTKIATHLPGGGVPIRLHDATDDLRPDTYTHGSASPLLNKLGVVGRLISRWMDKREVKEYEKRARNVLRQVEHQAFGHPSGGHGLFHRFRVDAFTVFAVPAPGPHGFHTLGRIVESLLRSFSNLIERLHHSQFLYILTTPHTFVSVNSYLPAPLMISIAITLTGLTLWARTAVSEEGGGEEKTERLSLKDGHMIGPASERRRRRPVLRALAVMLVCHSVGAVYLYAFGRVDRGDSISLPALTISTLLTPVLVATIFNERGSHARSLPSSTSHLIRAFTLVEAGMLIAVMSVLNFSLAAVTAVFLGLPFVLCFSPEPDEALAGASKGVESSSSVKVNTRLAASKALLLPLFLLLSPPGLLSLATLINGAEPVRLALGRALWDYHLLGANFLPFMCLAYWPVLLQAGVAGLLG